MYADQKKRLGGVLYNSYMAVCVITIRQNPPEISYLFEKLECSHDAETRDSQIWRKQNVLSGLIEKKKTSHETQTGKRVSSHPI